MQQVQVYDHFIGRNRELAMFSEWLTTPRAPWILYIYDALEEAEKKGGVGKTWLLHKYVDLVHDKHTNFAVATFDFFTIADRNQITIAQRVVATLQSLYPSWSAPAFTTALALYQSEFNRADTGHRATTIDTNIQERLSSALVEDLQMLDEDLHSTQKSLLVIFDTFELIEQNPVIAVLRLSQTFPDDYSFKHMRVIIAGRNKPNWQHTNWSGRSQEVLELPLRPFNLREMLHYFEAESIFSIPSRSPQALALHERTEGRPILIGLAIDVLNHRILTLDELIAISKSDFEGYLVTQVNKLENPLNWIILFMAHVYHRFNISILEWILRQTEFLDLAQELEYLDLVATFSQLSFVRRSSSSNDFVLHDEMQRLVVKYCWSLQDPQGNSRKEISHRLLPYYEQEISQAANEQVWQTLIIEFLYHRLYINLDDGLRYFHQQFQRATRSKKSSFARLLFQETQKFVSLLSITQNNDLLFKEAQLLRLERYESFALIILQTLESSPDTQWRAQHQKDLFQEIGSCYLQQSKLPEAATSFSRCLDIEMAEGNELRSTHLLVHLGIISRRRGQFDQALGYYEKSIALYKKAGRQASYATALTNMSIVYRLQGRVEEALRKCKIAWRIRLNLFHEGEGNETQVGLSLYILGTIYLTAENISDAERCFNEAFTIYLRTNYKPGLASVYNRWGQIQMLKSDFLLARQFFEKAQQLSYNIDDEQYINSLNKQGAIHAKQAQWKEAVVFFERAITHAQKVLDYYQQTESLIDLADALMNLELLERVEQTLQSAEVIGTQESFFYLLGRVELIRGKVRFNTKQYTTAFEHFAAYCRHMAYYNTSEFRISLRTVLDFLLEVPKDNVPPIAQELISYWKVHALDSVYPQLIEAFEDVQDSMAF